MHFDSFPPIGMPFGDKPLSGLCFGPFWIPIWLIVGSILGSVSEALRGPFERKHKETNRLWTFWHSKKTQFGSIPGTIWIRFASPPSRSSIIIIYDYDINKSHLTIYYNDSHFIMIYHHWLLSIIIFIMHHHVLQRLRPFTFYYHFLSFIISFYDS